MLATIFLSLSYYFDMGVLSLTLAETVRTSTYFQSTIISHLHIDPVELKV